MKRILSTFLSAFLLMSFCISQSTKPNTGKKFPTLIEINFQISPEQKDLLFAEYFLLSSFDSLKLIGSQVGQLGFIHEKYQQTHQGILVDGATVTVHSKNGKVVSISGNYREVKEINVSPVLLATDAFDLAVAYVGAERYAWDEGGFLGKTGFTRPDGELVLVTDQESITPPRLAYKFEIHATYPLYNADVFVDANTGEIFREESKIHTTDAIGTASTRYSGEQIIHTDDHNGSFRLRDYSRGNGILTWDATTAQSASQTTGTPNGASEYTDNDNSWTSAEYDNTQKDNAALDAHFAAAATYDFFASSFDRNSFDGNGSAINSYVNTDIESVFNYPPGYNDNAFWTGYVMVYGKGDTYGPLTTVDITGHEIGHAFCEYTANLAYSHESGAINESLSDIWGACVENYTNQNHGTNKDLWHLGSEIGATFRSMYDPNAFGQPDTYLGDHWYTGTGDNGGVHYNSGVGNHWFYIMSVGKSGTNDNGDNFSVSGIGIEKAAAITWRSEAFYLTSSSQYANWRNYSILAAEDLYGKDSPEVIAVTNAWYAVGVGQEYAPDIGCIGGNVDLSITLDNYPEETSWAIKDASGNTVESGGSYEAQPDGSTIDLSFDLNPGAYSFTIYDSYGDGICCGYGSGSYSLSSGNTIIVSGGNFGSSESTSFCVNNAEADTQAPSKPENLTAFNITENTISLTWDASIDNNGVNGYQVLVDGSLFSTVQGTNTLVNNLNPGTTYTIGVRAFDGAGNFSSAATVDVTTLNSPDTEAPAIPLNLKALNTTDNSTDLSWDPSTDNIGVTGYDIYVNGIFDGTTAETQYTLNNLLASTTYIFSVLSRDAAGNQSPPESIEVTTSDESGSSTIVLAHYFETGWDGWSDGGSDCYRYSGPRSFEGNFSIRLRDNSGMASSMTSDYYNISQYSQLEINFHFYPYSMENGEDFWVRYYDGNSWQTIGIYTKGPSFENNSFYVASVIINDINYTFPENARFRFQCDASGNQDHVYIDQVTVTASNPTSFVHSGGEAVASITELASFLENETEIEKEQQIEEDVILFPNPATDQLRYITEKSINTIRIFSINGMPMLEINQLDESESIDISGLNPGIYFLTIETQDTVLIKRFVKQ